ncbi:MAG: hypothetical protein JWQ98_2697 [Chlorobi bacterium]|nr:hypothetical protein [Chlorobiota bacterium]
MESAAAHEAEMSGSKAAVDYCVSTECDIAFGLCGGNFTFGQRGQMDVVLT